MSQEKEEEPVIVQQIGIETHPEERIVGFCIVTVRRDEKTINASLRCNHPDKEIMHAVAEACLGAAQSALKDLGEVVH